MGGMKTRILSLWYLTVTINCETPIERRPNAMAGGFNNGRDFFAQQDRNDNGEPLLSVEDVDMSNRLKPDLRCNNPIVPGSLSSDESRIVGGYQAQRSAWPFIVKIRIGCGGTIVSNKWIVTAAHCCRVSNIRFLDVTVGEYDRGANDVGAKTIQVKQRIIHPGFVPSNLLNDICMLELAEDIDYNDFAQPTCFPPKGSRIDQVQLGEGAMCYVAGWGRIGETLGTARILQETQVPIVNNTVCDDAYVRNHVTEEAMLCAGYAEGGIDACQGDSGGPLICVENDQPVLRGVVSWGIGCARRGLYGVYTRTSSYIDWVQDIVNPNNLNAGQIATTKPTSTTRPTKRPVTAAAGEQDTTQDCGDPAAKYRLANNVVVGCAGIICKFHCPEGQVATTKQVKCITRKKVYVPKKIKKGVHCKSVKPDVTASNSGGFSSGGFTSNSDAAVALNSGESNTNCGNVIKKFKLDTSLINVDCKLNSINTINSCALTCNDPSKRPTLDKVRCMRKNPSFKKWKFAPKKAKISCKLPAKGKQGAMYRKLDTLAEETCGFLPVMIDSPAEYFCESYTCHFYCTDPFMQPNREKLTCNPKKKSWWPKRITIFCH